LARRGSLGRRVVGAFVQVVVVVAAAEVVSE
jgi:hypothetical protein